MLSRILAKIDIVYICTSSKIIIFDDEINSFFKDKNLNNQIHNTNIKLKNVVVE